MKNQALQLAHDRDRYICGFKYCTAIGDTGMAEHYAEWVAKVEDELIALANRIITDRLLAAAAERAKTTSCGRSVVYSPFDDSIALGHQCRILGTTTAWMVAA